MRLEAWPGGPMSTQGAVSVTEWDKHHETGSRACRGVRGQRAGSGGQVLVSVARDLSPFTSAHSLSLLVPLNVIGIHESVSRFILFFNEGDEDVFGEELSFLWTIYCHQGHFKGRALGDVLRIRVACALSLRQLAPP